MFTKLLLHQLNDIIWNGSGGGWGGGGVELGTPFSPVKPFTASNTVKV